MPKGIRLADEYLDDIFQQVSLYQSEKKCSVNKACDELSKKLGISSTALNKQFQRARGRNRVITTVAKRKTPAKIAATTVSSSASMQVEVEKAIFGFMKNMGFFKRILACIIGLDKLCYSHHGNKKVH